MIYPIDRDFDHDILCPYCGGKTRRNYYATQSDAEGGMELLYDTQGTAYYLRRNHSTIPVSSLPHPLPYSLTAGGQIFLHRCSRCKELLPGGYGFYPAYIITLAGEKSAGKSAYLKGIPQASAFTELHKAGYPYDLVFEIGGNVTDAAATNLSSSGFTFHLYVQNKRTKEIVACVFLTDSAGEAQHQKHLYNSPRFYEVRNASDGAIYLMDASQSALSQGGAFQTFFSFVGQLQKPFPVAVTLTHFDEYLKQGPSQDSLLAPLDFTQSSNAIFDLDVKAAAAPQLSGETFANTSYRPSDVLSRFTFQQFIAQFFQPPADALLTHEPSAGFVVQSCSFDPNTGKEYFSRQMNVLDPLLWTLNKLNLFPICDAPSR